MPPTANGASNKGLWVALNVTLSILLGGTTHYLTGMTNHGERLAILETEARSNHETMRRIEGELHAVAAKIDDLRKNLNR